LKNTPKSELKDVLRRRQIYTAHKTNSRRRACK